MISEIHFAAIALQYRFRGKERKFSGSSEEILRQTVGALWNGKYFAAAFHHYRHFWMRDFGLALPGLLIAGKKEQALASLRFALAGYQKHDRLVTLRPSGKPHGFPGFTIDTLGWLLASLRLLAADELIATYKDFLTNKMHAMEQLLTSEGLVRSDVRSFGIRDHLHYRSSCYDAAILWRMAEDARVLNICEFPQMNPEQFQKHYWTGAWYREDLQSTRWSAEANLMPFLFGLDTDASHFQKATQTIWDSRLFEPIPLAYTTEQPQQITRTIRFFMHESQGPNTRWPILGILFLELLRHFHDPRAAEMQQRLVSMIERFGFFPEILWKDGSLYLSRWYKSDAGMLWGTRLLAVLP